MKVLITGGNGFIGTAMTSYLNSQGVATLDYSLPNHSILDLEDLLSHVEQADHVIHLAGLLGTHELTENPGPAVDVNIRGTVNVLNCVKKTDKRLLFISKPNVTLNTYSITKMAAENFCDMYFREFKTRCIILKVFNAYGPGQGLVVRKAIPNFVVSALQNKDIEIYGNGEQTMDLIHVDDVAKVFYACLTHPFGWDTMPVIEVGSGEEITVNDTVRMIINICRSKSSIFRLPMRRGEPPMVHVHADTTQMKKLGIEPQTDHRKKMLQMIDYYYKLIKASEGASTK